MKQLLSLFLFLLPCFALAQYPSNGNQKITLGEQTTADGLIWRGVASDTTLTAKSDTAAYFVLDTVNKKLYFYKISSTPKWNEIIGSGGGGSTLDTATMLLPYYRAGKTGIIQVSDVPTLNQNTTGSAATLTTSRTFQTNLASTSTASFNGSANVTPGVTGTLGVGNGGTGATTFVAVNNIPFTSSSGSLTTDNNFVYNTTNDRLGIGTASPSYTLDVNGTGSFKDSIFLGNVVIGKTRGNNNSIKFGINSGLGTANNNVAIGTNTLQNDTGGENVAIGFEAGKNMTTGNRNMLIGSYAGHKITTAGSILAIGFLSFIVWGHHMFITGMNPFLGSVFTFTTLLIAIPSAVKAFNYITTLWKGNLQLNPAMLFSIGLVSTFITGGLTGIILGDSTLDINVHDTYFVVAHFHLVMGISALYGLFAGVYHWFPKLFGRMLNKNLGYVHFWVTAVCAYGVFFPMHFIGMAGLPRRYYTNTAFPLFDDLQNVNVIITMFALVGGAFQLVFIWNFFHSMFYGKKAEMNPWRSNTLEWTAPVEHMHGNWPGAIPEVHRWPYDYSKPGHDEDFVPQTVPMGPDEEQLHH
jgi:hypothetical protein